MVRVPKLTLSFKGNVLKVYTVPEGVVTIGRDPSCDIHIDSLAIGPQHARIITRDGKSSLQDLGAPGGTLVNHEKISERELSPDDIIRIGKHTLRYRVDERLAGEERELPQPARPPSEPKTPTNGSAAPRGWLQILTGRNLGKTVKLKSGLTDLSKLGGSPALIAHRSDGYYLSSLGEADGLRLGDTAVEDRVLRLNDGDVIQAGELKLQFYLQPD